MQHAPLHPVALALAVLAAWVLLAAACTLGDGSEVTIVGCGDHPCDLDAGDDGDGPG